MFLRNNKTISYLRPSFLIMCWEKQASAMWLDIKLAKVLWWKEAAVEVKTYPWFSSFLVQAMQCRCIKRKVSWCLDINCLDATRLEWLLLTSRSIRPSFPGNTPKKKGNCAEYNTNPKYPSVQLIFPFSGIFISFFTLVCTGFTKKKS